MSKKDTLTHNRWRGSLWLLGLLGLLLLGCSSEGAENGPASDPLPTNVPSAEAIQPTLEGATATPALSPTLDPTIPPTPTQTPEPLAASVNGQPITLAEYEQELAKYEQAQQTIGLEPEDNYRQQVLNTLIEQTIFEQTAAANGLGITPEMIEARIVESIAEVGEDNFQAWLEANQFTRESFAEQLETEMLTEQVVNLVTRDVPFEVPQIRARYLQVNDAALIQTLVDQLAAGADFATLARTHSLDAATAQDGGDLGFFPEGFLLVPELDEAVFQLEVGEVSDIISVTFNDVTTYYLITPIERDEARLLTPGQRAILLERTFEGWLQQQLDNSEIERFVEEDGV